MITLTKKDKEVDISLKYSESIGGGVKIEISAKADFSHHAIEGLFDLLDRLARMEKVCHQSKEWRDKPCP